MRSAPGFHVLLAEERHIQQAILGGEPVRLLAQQQERLDAREQRGWCTIESIHGPPGPP
jgi:hypothetical protein